MSTRRAAATRQAWISALLCLGIAVAAYVLARRLPLRADLTAERQYTLAPATRALLGRLQDRLQVKLYFNRDIEGAESLLPARILVEDLLEEMRNAGHGLLSVETVDPTTDQLAASHAREVGIMPLSLSAGGVASLQYSALYQGVELRYQDRSAVIPFAVPAGFEYAFAARLSQLLDERPPAIGIFSREPAAPPALPGAAAPPVEGRVYQRLRQVLEQRYDVRDVPLDQGQPLAQELTALVVAAPEDMSAREVYELDQYLAAGGHVLVLYDGERFAHHPDHSFERTPLHSGLEEWLQGQGVHVSSQLVWDRSAYQVPVAEQHVTLPSGQQVSQDIRMGYGFWPLLQGDSFASGHVVTTGQNELYLMWAHVTALDTPPPGIAAETLLRSSHQSWLLPADADPDWSPENIDDRNRQAAGSGPAASWPLAVVLRGAFPARFAADAAPPLAPPDDAAPDPAALPAAPPAHVSAAAPGVLVVLGDSDLFRNEVLEQSAANAQFAESLLDWLAQDESLIGLRSRGQQVRPLVDFYAAYVEAHGGEPEQEAARQALDRDARASQRGRERLLSWLNVLAPAALVGLLGLAHWQNGRRRARRSYASGAGAAP